MDLSKLDYKTCTDEVVDFSKLNYTDVCTAAWYQEQLPGFGELECLALEAAARGVKPKEFKQIMKRVKKKIDEPKFSVQKNPCVYFS